MATATSSTLASTAAIRSRIICWAILSKPSARGLLRQCIYKSWQTDLYANNNFHVRRNLTINMGIAWQFANPMAEKYNNLAIFDTETGQLDFAGKNGTPRGLLSSHYLDFAPRLGFAYYATTNWAIRGSYGIFYDTTPGNDLAWNGIKAPFNLSTTFVSGDTPTIAMSQLFPGANGNVLPAGPNLLTSRIVRIRISSSGRSSSGLCRGKPRSRLPMSAARYPPLRSARISIVHRFPQQQRLRRVPLQQRRPYPQYRYPRRPGHRQFGVRGPPDHVPEELQRWLDFR